MFLFSFCCCCCCCCRYSGVVSHFRCSDFICSCCNFLFLSIARPDTHTHTHTVYCVVRRFYHYCSSVLCNAIRSVRRRCCREFYNMCARAYAHIFSVGRFESTLFPSPSPIRLLWSIVSYVFVSAQSIRIGRTYSILVFMSVYHLMRKLIYVDIFEVCHTESFGWMTMVTSTHKHKHGKICLWDALFIHPHSVLLSFSRASIQMWIHFQRIHMLTVFFLYLE